jgi:hypothetical protein
LKLKPNMQSVPSLFVLSGMSAEALSIGDTRERQILRISEVSLDLPIEEAQFLLERWMAVWGKPLG